MISPALSNFPISLVPTRWVDSVYHYFFFLITSHLNHDNSAFSFSLDLAIVISDLLERILSGH